MIATRPPPTPDDLGQREHDRLASHRASDTRPMRKAQPIPAEQPMDRPAFIRLRLEAAVAQAREQLAEARAQVMSIRGKAEKLQARRNVRICSHRLSEAEKALAAELRAELAAPAVQRQDHAHQGQTLREARVVMDPNKRAELVSAIDRLLRRGSITWAEHAAAVRYRDAWHDAHRDAMPVGGVSDNGRSPPGSGNRRIEESSASGYELDAARRAIGVFGAGFIEWVVLEERTIAAFAQKKGDDPTVCMGIFRMVLVRLGEHFAATRDEHNQNNDLHDAQGFS